MSSDPIPSQRPTAPRHNLCRQARTGGCGRRLTGRSAVLRVLLAVAVLVLGSAVAGADGLIVINEPPPPVGPAPQYRFAPLVVRSHHVTVSITDQTAVTEIDQVFFNPNRQRLEGTYLFPLPKGAQLEAFTMDINGRQVQAELLDADKARQIYEGIVRRMKDPALLEYAGQGLLKARIYPIEPLSDKRVVISYRQLLRRDGGVVEYRYPLNTEKFSAQPLESVSIKVTVECSKGLRSIYSPSHQVELRRDGPKRAVVGWEASQVTPDRDLQLFFTMESKYDVGLDLLAHRRGSEPGFFTMLISPAAYLAAEQTISKDVVFVLDTSGSMAEGGKLEQAQRALHLCLANLNQGDRFEIIRFSTEAEPLLDGLTELSAASRARADQLIDELRPIGGTAISEALQLAIATGDDRAGLDRPFLVVFLTDGRPTIGNTDEAAIIKEVGNAIGKRPVRIFCFGVGTDINTHLLDRITEQTRAVSQYVLPDEDIEVKLSSWFSKINHPVLANPRLDTGKGVRLSKLHPKELPDLFRGDQLVVLGRYSGSGPVAVTLTGTVNGKQRRYTFETSLPAEQPEHGFIARLWATRRVGYLLDQIRLHGESAELRQEVSELARRYGIVTPYTAYLIVEDEARRQVPVSSRSLQEIEGDAGLREESGRLYAVAKRERSGAAAVGGAQAMDALKQAEVVASAPAAATRHSQQGQDGEAARRLGDAIASQQVRHVEGRTFYRNGGRWIDSATQDQPSARRVVIRFASDEYFALVARHPEAAPWLSLGQDLVLLLDGKIYEISG